MSQDLPELLARFSLSVRPGLGQEFVPDKGPYLAEGRRSVPPSVSLARAEELFRKLPFQFHINEVPDPLVDHPTTALRITGVPRQHRMGHMCFGKGATLDHALASAACEAVERVTTWPRDDESYFDAATRILDDRRFLHLDPRALPLPKPGTDFAPYDEDMLLSWVPAWCLLARAPILVPRTLTHLLAVDETAQLFIDNRPNGSASGNTLTEAVLHALYELIERDSLCIFTYHALPAREIDPTSVSPAAGAVYAALLNAGVELRIRDCSSDLGVPVVHAYCYDRNGGPQRGPVHVWGCGCHLDARIATERALFELVQDHAMSARDMARGLAVPADASEELRNDRRRYHSGVESWFAHLARTRGRISLHDFEPAPGTPADELATLLARLQRAGVRHVAVADLTTYDRHLPVVRVVCPELAFIPWAKVAEKPSARLLDAPERMGYVFGRDYDASPRTPAAAFIV